MHDYPPGFRPERITTNGATLSVHIGGKGRAVVLAHGDGESGDKWEPLAAKLMVDHTVIVPICAAWDFPITSSRASTRLVLSRASMPAASGDA